MHDFQVKGELLGDCKTYRDQQGAVRFDCDAKLFGELVKHAPAQPTPEPTPAQPDKPGPADQQPAAAPPPASPSTSS